MMTSLRDRRDGRQGASTEVRTRGNGRSPLPAASDGTPIQLHRPGGRISPHRSQGPWPRADRFGSPPAYDVLFQIVAGQWIAKRGVSGPLRMLKRLVLLAIALSTSSSPARAESVFTSRPDDAAAVYVDAPGETAAGAAGDHTAVVQAALDRAGANPNGGIVFIPSGR